MERSRESYMEEILLEAEKFACLISPEHLTAAVPGCPDWNLERLVDHMVKVYSSVVKKIMKRGFYKRGFDASQYLRRVEKIECKEEAAECFIKALGDLLEQLEFLYPDDKIQVWGRDRPGSFYHRRMAHETAIHRWDAQSAIGDPAGFNGDFAADGVDEMFDVLIPMMQERQGVARPEGSLHLHRTDGEGEWMCRIEDDRLCVKREHGRADAAVRGTAEQLILALWERIELDELEVFGDREVAEAWMAVSP